MYQLEQLIKEHFIQENDGSPFHPHFQIPDNYKNYFIHGVFDFLDENTIIYAKHDEHNIYNTDLVIQVPLNMSFFRDVSNSFLDLGRSLGYLIKQKIKDDEQLIFSDLMLVSGIYQIPDMMSFGSYIINIKPKAMITKKQEFHFKSQTL